MPWLMVVADDCKACCLIAVAVNEHVFQRVSKPLRLRVKMWVEYLVLCIGTNDTIRGHRARNGFFSELTSINKISPTDYVFSNRKIT
jgi:hypothetical protein